MTTDPVRPSPSWLGTQRPLIRARLRGRLSELAALGRIRSTDLMHCLLRLRPLPPKVARRISYAFGRMNIPGRLDWIDLVDPLRTNNPLFAPASIYSYQSEAYRTAIAEEEVESLCRQK